MRAPVRNREEIIARLGAAVRSSRRWTQKEIAELAGMEEYALSKTLSGTRKLTAYELVRVACALEIPVEEFVYEDEERAA